MFSFFLLQTLHPTVSLSLNISVHKLKFSIVRICCVAFTSSPINALEEAANTEQCINIRPVRIGPLYPRYNVVCGE